MTDTDPKQINKEACAWIAKLHGAEPSASELNDFREWMAQSQAHKAEIRHLAKLWGELNVLTELAVVVEPSVRKGRWLKTFLATFLGRHAIAGAMACAALLLVAVLVVPFNSGTTSPPVVYATVVGEQKLVPLLDGSTILLNTNSRVRVDYNSNARDIHLIRGQAHFNVKSDPSKPFQVFADQGMIRAVGTAFTVYLKEKFLEVTVTEGSIELNAIGQPTAGIDAPAPAKMERLAVVNAGQNATFDRRVKSVDSIETVEAPELTSKLSWRDGILKFSGTPLQEVVNEVGRYTNVSIVILDPAISELRIGGLFKVGETEKLFEALESSFSVRVERKNENLVHLAAVASDTSLR